jgi:hypothetical protein
VLRIRWYSLHSIMPGDGDGKRVDLDLTSFLVNPEIAHCTPSRASPRGIKSSDMQAIHVCVTLPLHQFAILSGTKNVAATRNV